MVSVASLKEARSIAQNLLEKKAAACVSISSFVESHFVWKGKIQKQKERLLLIKTSKKKYPLLETLIFKKHSYETPEIISVPIEKGLPSYLKWVESQVEEA